MWKDWASGFQEVQLGKATHSLAGAEHTAGARSRAVKDSGLGAEQLAPLLTSPENSGKFFPSLTISFPVREWGDGS